MLQAEILSQIKSKGLQLAAHNEFSYDNIYNSKTSNESIYKEVV